MRQLVNILLTFAYLSWKDDGHLCRCGMLLIFRPFDRILLQSQPGGLPLSAYRDPYFAHRDLLQYIRLENFSRFTKTVIKLPRKWYNSPFLIQNHCFSNAARRIVRLSLTLSLIPSISLGGLLFSKQYSNAARFLLVISRIFEL